MQPSFQKTLSFSAPRIPANKNTRKSHSQKQECYQCAQIEHNQTMDKQAMGRVILYLQQ